MRVVSLFAGCGGLDLGLKQAGHKIVYASDIDKDCISTYIKNIGDHAHLEDVYELKGSELPKYDLLTAGFPCQGFSIANLYRSAEDKRNDLYTQIVRLLDETSPSFFLGENVPGILSLEKGKVVEAIEEGFKKAGDEYEVKRFVLNAVNYNTPQNRKRVIFLGITKRFPTKLREKMFNLFPPVETNSDDPDSNLKPLKTLRQAIEGLPEPGTPKANEIPNHICTKHKVKINGYIGNRALSWDKPGPTIVGRGGGTGGPVIAIHPNLKRRFSVRETALIQGFPKHFIFEGSKSSQYRQIGNAVAVPFAKALGVALKNIEEQYLLDSTPEYTEKAFQSLLH